MDSKIEIQNLLPETEFVCFVIPALFSKPECEELLNSDVKQSFQKAISNYPTYYRNNDRLVIDSEELSKKLFEKVKPYLPNTIETISNIQTENGLWTLSELNNRLRFCKYSANQYFHRHLDGIHYRSENKQSKLTFMIYLNDATEFEGGRTLFYKTIDTNEIWASYIPRRGDLIVFDHNVWHEGEELKSGEKFVLRSDILYTKSKGTNFKPVPFSKHLGYIWKLLKFNNNTLLSGGRDKVINVWDVKGELIQTLHGHENSILCIEKIDETIFLSGSRDKQIKVWKKEENKGFELFKSFSNHSAIVLSLCKISKHLFASSSGDNSIKITNIDGQIEQELTEHSNWVWQVIKLNGFNIASCSEDNSIKIWDYRKPKSIKTFIEECPIICLTFDSDTNMLISGNLRGEITIRELTDDFDEIKIRKIQAHTGIIRTLIKLNNTLIASGGEDNTVKIWDIENGECVSELQHQNFVQSLELVNKNKLLSASYDGTIKMWDI